MTFSRVLTEEATIKEAEITAAPALHLADSLRREGKYSEALALVAGELESLDKEDVGARLACLDMRAKVERTAGRLAASLRILLEASPLAELSEDHARKAIFHSGLAVTCQLMGDAGQALIEYAATAYHWGEAGRHAYAGCAENNVALIHAAAGEFADARRHLARARSYFMDDPVRSAEVDDSEAQILLLEGKPVEAERLVVGAMKTFYDYGETELLRQARYTLLRASAEAQAEGSR